jgi:serine/threonine protein kinase
MDISGHCLYSKGKSFPGLLALHGVDYWRRFMRKMAFYKQTSFDLAERESRFLSRFEGDYFPRLVDAKSERDYSLITFQKIRGQNLNAALPEINSSVVKLYDFIQHCLNILVALKEKGLTHRNICRDTILVKDGRPILLDFSWAISEQEPYFSPRAGGRAILRMVIFDVYSMGKILEH